MIILFDGAFIAYAILMICLVLGGGLISVTDFLAGHQNQVIAGCVIALLLYVLTVSRLTKKGEIEGSRLLNSIAALFAGSQLVYFAVFAVYRIALESIDHPVASLIHMVVYFFALGANVILLTLATVDYDEFIVDSYAGCAVLMGVIGWVINFIFLIARR